MERPARHARGGGQGEKGEDEGRRKGEETCRDSRHGADSSKDAMATPVLVIMPEVRPHRTLKTARKIDWHRLRGRQAAVSQRKSVGVTAEYLGQAHQVPIPDLD